MTRFHSLHTAARLGGGLGFGRDRRSCLRQRNARLCRQLVRRVSTYYGGESDCPDGLNPMSTEFYKRELLRLGYSEADATKLLKDFPGNPGKPDGEYIKIMGDARRQEDERLRPPRSRPTTRA